MNTITKSSLIVNMAALCFILLLTLLQQQIHDAISVVFAVSGGICVFSSLVTAIKYKLNGKSAERIESKRRQVFALLAVLIILTVIVTIISTSLGDFVVR
jgi:drug/metabolite transporter superfamily protein YnfA